MSFTGREASQSCFLMKPASHPLRMLCQRASPGCILKAKLTELPRNGLEVYSTLSLNACLNNSQRGSSLLNTKPDVCGHQTSLAPNSDFIQSSCSCHSQFLPGHSPTQTFPRVIMNLYSFHTKAEWEEYCLPFCLLWPCQVAEGHVTLRCSGSSSFPGHWRYCVLQLDNVWGKL